MLHTTTPRTWAIAPLLIALTSTAQVPELQEHIWVGTQDMTVSAALVDTATNTLYVAGSNGMRFWPPTPTEYGAVLDLDEGWPTLTGSPSGGNVWSAVADGSGGWFIGGRFTAVNGVARQGLARLNADGSLNEAWDPGGVLGGTFPTVYAMAVKDGILYVGGNFTSAGGAVRYRVAAFDIDLGVITNWNQGNSTNDGEVRAIAATDAAVYVGGTFTSMGGQPRTRLAALDPASGEALINWAPTANIDVLCMVATDDLVYVGGEFSQVNATSRGKLAALDATDGSLTTWNPSANSTVHTMALDGDTLFIGGEFNTTGGANRSRLAALRTDMDTNNAMAWNPSVTGVSVRSIQLAQDVVYVGGQFTSVGIVPVARAAAAAFRRSTGDVTNWDPGTSSQPIYALAYDGVAVYAGGGFYAIGVRVRPGMAAFDLATGKPKTWVANVNTIAGGWVRSLALKGDTLFMGGIFSTVNGVPRHNLAAVNKYTGEVLAWQVITDDYVFSMEVVGQRLILGGAFTAVNGVPRAGLAAVNIASATVVASWQADCTGGLAEVYGVQEQNDRIFVSGWFTSVDGTPRQALAVLNATTGDLDPWQASISPNGSGTMIAAGDRVFTKDLTTLIALDPVTGTQDPNWVCSSPGSAPFEIGGDLLYARSLTPLALTAYSRASAQAQPWQAAMDGIFDLHRAGNYLAAVGVFSTVDGAARSSLAVWMVPDVFEDLSTGLHSADDDVVGVFPNPSEGTFTIAWNANNADASYTVYDQHGRVVRPAQRIAGRSQSTIDLGEAAEGMYLIRVVGKNSVSSFPIMVQRD